MLTTPKWKIKYPAPTDLVSGASEQFEQMADSLDTAVETMAQTPPVKNVRVNVMRPSDPPTVRYEDGGYTGERKLTFELPRTARFTASATVAGLPTDDPAVSAFTDTAGDVDLRFTLPRAQVIESVRVAGLKATEEPTVQNSINGPTGNRDILLGLPHAQQVDVGKVTQAMPSSRPAVSRRIIPSTGNAALDFSLPRAPRISMGNVTQTPAGTPPAATMNTDTNGDMTLNLAIPKGDKGDQGEPGDPAATMTIQDENGNRQGTAVKITNDTWLVILQYVIPRAADGVAYIDILAGDGTGSKGSPSRPSPTWPARQACRSCSRTAACALSSRVSLTSSPARGSSPAGPDRSSPSTSPRPSSQESENERTIENWTRHRQSPPSSRPY